MSDNPLLNDDEQTWLEGFFEKYNANRGKVSDWERGFCDDQMTRWDEYAGRTKFSAKQWAILDRVAGKLGYAASGDIH